MPLFTRTIPDFGTPFNRNERVQATVDLPGVPAGTEGRIKMVNGFDWRRYWVFFENGISLGQLDSDELVRPSHWDAWHQAKADAAAAAERAAASAADAAADAAAGAETAAAAAGDDPLAAIRAMVPPHLLERSAEALQRLGVTR